MGILNGMVSPTLNYCNCSSDVLAMPDSLSCNNQPYANLSNNQPNTNFIHMRLPFDRFQKSKKIVSWCQQGMSFTNVKTSTKNVIYTSCTWNIIDNIMVVKEQAHGLPHNAKKEPKNHISNLHPSKSSLAHVKINQDNLSYIYLH